MLAAAAIWFLFELFQPFHGSPHGQVTVTIPAHSTARQVGDQLARDGVIPSGFFFEVRATLAGDRGDLLSGTYHLQHGMTYGAVLKILTTPPPKAKTTNITIIEGRRRAQINDLLRSQGVKGSYFAATRHSPLINFAAYGAPRRTPDLEGFLFPDTYQLVEPISIQKLVDDQLKTFRREFARVNLSYARSKHLTPYDVLIIASMVEGEAATAHDRPLIASVIYNRLRLGMPLQIDATVRYAVGNYTNADHPVPAPQSLALQHLRTTRVCRRRRSTIRAWPRSRPRHIPPAPTSCSSWPRCAATAPTCSRRTTNSSRRRSRSTSTRAAPGVAARPSAASSPGEGLR